MIRNAFLATMLVALAACGGDESETTTTPDVGSGAVDVALTHMTALPTWEIDREASSVGFRAVQNDRSFDGSFGRWNAGIVFNPENPSEEGEIEAVIDLTSVDAGNRDRNEALPEEGWFHTALHPVALFRTHDIERTAENDYVAEGTLTIKGITRDVSMPFAMTVDAAGRAIADGSVLLDRSQFGVGSGEFADGKWVGLEVEVLLHIEAVPAG